MADNFLPENLIADDESGGGAVESVNGETGVVVLDAADVGAAATSHNHNASQVNAGTLAIARIPTGTTSSTVSLGNHTHSGLMTGSATTVADAAADPPTQAEFNALLAALRARGVIS